jgi:hypothetical protein
MPELTHEQRVALRKHISATFDLNGIRALCEAINVDFENLGGDTRDRKALELVGYCQRRSQFGVLIDACITAAPEVAWPLPGGGQHAPAPAEIPQTSRARDAARDVTILFMSANPIGQDALRLGAEARAIKVAIRNAKRFKFEEHHATQVDDIQALMLEHKPDIVHFAGHGKTSDGLVFEDSMGKAQAVRPEALGMLFRTLKGTRCVVMNACWSAIQANPIRDAVGCVIGMSSAIGDIAAKRFAEGFYLGLSFGESCKTAFNLGCNKIDLVNLTDTDIPQIQCRPDVDPAKLLFV